MGIFKLLFGKKNKKEDTIKIQEANTEEISEIQDKNYDSEPKATRAPKAKNQTKINTEKSKTATEEKISSEVKEDIYDSETADELSTETGTKKVKVKGFGGAFEIKRSKDNRFVFNLYAANRVIVATSQIYSSSQSAVTGIKSVIANAEKAAIEDQTLKTFVPQGFPKWEIYIDKAGQFRFRLLASNGSCVCHSQGYTQKSTCKKGIESIIRTVKSAKIDKAYLKNND